MGERGPAPKPRSLHEKQGTYRSDRHGSGKLPVCVPDMPPDVTGHAQAAWNTISRHLETAGLVTEIDGLALRMLCESWALYLEACDDIRSQGLIVLSVTKAGENRIANPSIKIRSDCWKQVYMMARQFGLTPSSRTGLDTATLTDDGEDLAGILGIGVN